MLKLAWRNIVYNPLTTFLSAILFAISITIIILLNIVGFQLTEKFDHNRQHIHMVVGAPGSKIDLILSSVYHVSPPIQNVKISDVDFILKNPSVSVVPIALGDHYATGNDRDAERRRIVGTDSSYLDLYGVKVEKGRLFRAPMEATIGFEVHALGLNIGDTFTGTHGVEGHGGHVHEDQVYTVVGIMEPSGTVLDQLILCDIRSVWQVHEGHGSTGARVISKESIKEYPTQAPIRSVSLTDKQTDSLHNLIDEKIQNILKLKNASYYTADSLGSSRKKIITQTLRIRSNVKAILDASRLLAGNTYAGRFGGSDSLIDITDSIKLFSQTDMHLIDESLRDLKATHREPGRGLLYYARELEELTYNITNGYKLAEHDSIVKQRRKYLEKLKQNFKKHYLLEYPDEEVTSLLITIKSGGAIEIQRTIGEYYPNLNAALVEVEVKKLSELVEPGVEYVRLIAYLIMVISGISVFISLLRALRERKYELALLRVLGANRLKIFVLVVLEGMILSLFGFVVGFILSHTVAEIMADFLESRYHYHFTGMIFLKNEWYVLLGTVGIGFAASLLPAIMATMTNISATLSTKK